ncbi:MAG TPA: heavy metal translocating P-type ATPase [Streptosporangiaceae bacterium]|jgi:heavy metal translocating P-type ATPase
MRPPTSRGLDALFVAATGGLAAGGAAWWLGAETLADLLWLLVTIGSCAPAAWWVVTGLLHRRFGSDVIAVLALAGTIAVHEYLAGAVIGVMLTSGRLLEQRAERRARKDLRALLSLAPRLAHRVAANDAGQNAIVTIDAAEVRPGDRLLVRPGEVVPVDGLVTRGPAVLDESTLTGEPLAVAHGVGDEVRSGAVNCAEPFELRATTDAASSTYAGIVRLAEEAAAANAPFVRLADRYAAVFLPVTLALAGLAWLVAGDPVRAVAVLVVATPCPLILAAPIAFVSGLSRCAHRGVVVKGGSVLERLARARVLLFDKTGTVTAGRPTLVDVLTKGTLPASELLRLAASLDQVSPHVLASAIVRGAGERGLSLTAPVAVTERPGQGASGTVDGHMVALGRAEWAGQDDPAWVARIRRRAAARGAVTVFAGVDGRLAGVLLLQDRIRPDAARTFRLLRGAGIERAVMVTGDRAAVAASIADMVGADAVHAEQTPAGKVDMVRAESARATTVMAGDGVNDAPALAAAGVGVALGARGATASSDAADVVITIDRLERLAETLAIARRTVSIARQSVLMGMGLSLAAMAVAALGLLTPTIGAVLQEGIDVTAILWSLRAATPGRDRWARLHGDEAELVRRLDEEHRGLWPRIERLPAIADALAQADSGRRTSVAELTSFLDDLAAHERKDERLLYPAVAHVLGGADPTGTMDREHAEIADLTRRIRLLTTELGDEPAFPDTRHELRRAIEALHTILRLHFAQEEESYFVLADPPDA